MLVARPTIGLPGLTVTPIASRVAALIAGERHELIGPLMESLDEDLLPRDDRAASLLGVRLHSLDAAIERSLRIGSPSKRYAPADASRVSVWPFMSTVQVSIQIEAPIEDVWETIMDPERLKDWVTIHKSVSNVSADSLSEGAKMDQVLVIRGVHFKVHWSLEAVGRAQHRAVGGARASPFQGTDSLRAERQRRR